VIGRLYYWLICRWFGHEQNWLKRGTCLWCGRDL